MLPSRCLTLVLFLAAEPVTAQVAGHLPFEAGRDIATGVADKGTEATAIQCGDADIVVAYGGIVKSGGRYVIQKARYSSRDSLSFTPRTVTCTLASADSAIGTFKAILDPPSMASLKPEFKPTAITFGETIQPQVILRAVFDSSWAVVDGATLQLQFPGQVDAAPQVTSGKGIASFPAITIKAGVPNPVVKLVIGARTFTQTVAMSGKLAQITPAPAGVKTIVVGKTFTISAKLADSVANDACLDGAVYLHPIRMKGYVALAGSKEASSAILMKCDHTVRLATTPPLWYVGPTDTLDMEVVSGAMSEGVRVAALPAAADHIRILRQPARFIAADPVRKLSPAPHIRLEDEFGNHIAGHSVLASAKCIADKKGDPCDISQLAGTVIVRTDTGGNATFDSLSFVGMGGRHRFCFTDLDSGRSSGGSCVGLSEWSDTLYYDVDREFNKGFVLVSAIHSIAGTQKPVNEFFDLRFRTRLPGSFSTLVAADLSLTRKSIADTLVSSKQRDVFDAVVMLNWSGQPNRCRECMRVTDAQTDALDRLIFVGAQARLFTGVPYAGLHAGWVEMRHSLFFGSSVTAGWVAPLSYTPVKTDDNDVLYPSRNNLVADAFIRSSDFEFLKFLNIRGTILFPLDKGRRVQSRLAVAVPVGTNLSEF